MAEYGPSFQVVQSVHANTVEDTYFAVLDFDSHGWALKGGSFGYQLLDGLFQVCFVLPTFDPQIVAYAGGFEVSASILYARIAIENV